MHDTPRRLLLRVALKLLTLAAITTITIALLDGRDEAADTPESAPTLQLSIDALPSGRPQRIEWQGGPLQLLSTQQGKLHLFYDRGGNLGCPLAWQPPGSANAPEQPWHGGFRDQCSGTWYRQDGSALDGANHNLHPVPYRLLAGNLMEIGGNGDNAAPAVSQ